MDVIFVKLTLQEPYLTIVQGYTCIYRHLVWYNVYTLPPPPMYCKFTLDNTAIDKAVHSDLATAIDCLPDQLIIFNSESVRQSLSFCNLKGALLQTAHRSKQILRKASSVHGRKPFLRFFSLKTAKGM